MAKAPPLRRYWDSSAFLAWLRKEGGRVKACEEVIRAAEDGKAQIVTSAVSLTEVIKTKKGQPVEMPPSAAEQISAFFKQPYIIVVELDRFIAEDARGLIWTYPGLKPKDAIHAATAIRAKVFDLDTYDEDFRQLNGKVGNPPLTIGPPLWPQAMLDLVAPPKKSN